MATNESRYAYFRQLLNNITITKNIMFNIVHPNNENYAIVIITRLSEELYTVKVIESNIDNIPVLENISVTLDVFNCIITLMKFTSFDQSSNNNSRGFVSNPVRGSAPIFSINSKLCSKIEIVSN